MTTSGSTHSVCVTDTSEPDTFYFKVKVTAEGGAVHWTTKLAVQISCPIGGTTIYSPGGNKYDEASIPPWNPDQENEVGELGWYTWLPFTSSRVECPVNRYTVTTSNDGTALGDEWPEAIEMVELESTGSFANMTAVFYGGEYHISANETNRIMIRAQPYTFYIKVEASGPSYAYFPASLTMICGNRSVSIDHQYIENPQYFSLDDSRSEKVGFKFFPYQSSLPACPVVYYGIMDESESMTTTTSPPYG